MAQLTIARRGGAGGVELRLLNSVPPANSPKDCGIHTLQLAPQYSTGTYPFLRLHLAWGNLG